MKDGGTAAGRSRVDGRGIESILADEVGADGEGTEGTAAEEGGADGRGTESIVAKQTGVNGKGRHWQLAEPFADIRRLSLAHAYRAYCRTGWP